MTRRIIAACACLFALSVGCSERTGRPAPAGHAPARSEVSRAAPVPPELVITTRERTVATSELASCAIRGGALRCWGLRRALPRPSELVPPDDPRARAFLPHEPPIPPTAVLVPGVPRAVVMDTERDGGCVLAEDGAVWCWGRPDPGCPAERWQRVSLSADAVELAVLGEEFCARLLGGRVECWGGFENDGRERPTTCAPRTITRADGAPLEGIHRLEVAAGIDAEGRLYAWGNDDCGQISRAANPEERLPESYQARLVEGLPPVVDVATTGFGTCVLSAAGDVLCWGHTGLPDHRELAGCAATTELERRDLPSVRHIACNVGTCAAVTADDRVHTWGSTTFTASARGLRSIAVSGDGGCWAADEGVRCWGSALHGVHLDLTEIDEADPRRHPPPAPVPLPR